MTYKKTALFEIMLLVSASFAFSYLVEQTNQENITRPNESRFVQGARAAFMYFFGGNLVSAIESPLWTCPLDSDGLRCQEYGSGVCNERCTTSCFQGARRDFSECREGTCIDPIEGTCSPNTPQTLCATEGGTWDARPLAEIPACRPGCCLMGSQALFRTETACNALRARFNADVVFEPVTSELACLAMANQAEEGACVLGEVEPSLYGCRLTTHEQCTTLDGTFYRGFLCSNPSLNTTCLRQTTTNCVLGKDEVYWFDSCGNRENIYDSIRREESWNNGLILPKDASCELGSSSNPLLRQSSCGNCNYLLGNRCGAPQGEVDSPPSFGSFVCKDLSCVDDKGKTRKHGESWCAFNSRIGLQGATGSNEQRSTDVPGSEHFRQTCANGIITTETCGTFRNNICVESAIDGPGANDFSQAACRPNQWQLCLAANQESEGIEDPVEAARVIKDACDLYTDCYLKTVDLKGSRGTFAFNVCLPKYAPGFDLQSSGNGEEAQALCSLATMACKQVKVKGLFGGGKEYNALCTQALGAESMNNFCTSLGDCGAEANVQGDYSNRGFRVTTSRGEAPAFTNAYISGLRALADPRPGQRVEPLSQEELSLLLGAPKTPGTSGYSAEPAFNSLMMVSGMGGIALAYAVYSAPGTIVSISNYLGLATPLPTSVAGPPAPALGGYAGAAAGALIGAAGTAYLLDALGISAGLPAPVRFALIGLGAFAGYAIGGYASVGASFSSYALGVGITTGGWALVVLVVIIAIFALLGIGKKKETNVKFQCLPWQPPLGGARCEQCGSDGLPCSKYQCQSLGQACRYLNQNGEAQCVNAAVDDTSAPFIQEDASVLGQGYRYTQTSTLGYRLEGSGTGGCVPRFSPIRLGIATNELAQCKVANTHTENFEAMNEYFQRANDNQNPLFRRNHTMYFSIPSNEAIQNEQSIDNEFDNEPGEQGNRYSSLFMPDSSGNVNLYVRCTDATGNKNIQEYAINFCVTAEPDLTAPVISSFNPPSPGYVALNATDRKIRFWTNEPAECRWADSDRAFESMTEQASCSSSLGDGTIQGWMCNATLPAPLNQNERTFYIRCADQPWVNGSTSSSTQGRNMNMQGTPYVLRKTSIPLRITSVSPSNVNLFVLGLPARVNLTVTTAGGADGQARYCSYTIGSYVIPFFETGGDTHRQPGLTLVAEGNYSYPITCEDSAGNRASDEIRFGIGVDSEGPRITRVYREGGQLTVVTNEPARCAYSLSSCSFNFVNGTLMSGEERVHASTFNADISHYIYCRDRFDNVGSCTSVRGSVI